VEALIAKNITKRYTNHIALEDVTLTIPEKSIYGLLGPNGAGKTTFIRIVNQIINSDAGEISIFGEKLSEKHVGIIGYLPEERGLYKKLKVGQLKGLSKSEALERSKKWVTKFEVKDWWNKKVEDLSKGMAQKVQFISTVMHEPKLIILDEPFSGFDPVNAKLITEQILELRDNGSTIIFSTHRMETVEDLCDHIALINKSKKIVEGTKKHIKQTYKSNTFVVDHKGIFSLNGSVEIVSQTLLEDNFYQTVLKMNTETNPNELIRNLTNLTEVHSFIEKVPTMSEIFINLVKGKSDE
jgi:ABC-2 type transport system ATP-binding protein